MTLLVSASPVNISGRGRPSDSNVHIETVAEFSLLADLVAPPLWRGTGARSESAVAVDAVSRGSIHAASRAENTNVSDFVESIGNNRAPTWGSPIDTVFTLEQGATLDMSFGVRFTDPDNDPLTILQVSGELPPGVTYDPVTHLLSAASDAQLGLSDDDLIFSANDSQATVRNVGPGKPYTTVRAAILAAGDGDTIQIDPGDYLGDVATITAHNLLIKGTSTTNRARLFANGAHQSDKGILVLEGDDCTFENMEFHQVAGPSQNLAGVRHDGAGLTTFRNCGFFDNENGILSGGGGEVLMEFCEFARNGFGDGQTHNVYFGTHPKVTARDCYFHEAHIGHEFKSRAKENILERCYFVNGNGTTGDASYLVNADNGGKLVMRGCMLHKGVNADNQNSIFHNNNIWGASFNSILLEHCTLVHEYPSGSFINLSSGTVTVTLTACLFASNGRPLVSGATPVQNGNYHTTVDKFPFVAVIADPNFWPDSSIFDQLDLPSVLVPTYQMDAPHVFQQRSFASALVIGSVQNSLQAAIQDYWAVPSLQDEINFYANPDKPGGAWTWTSADQNFDFSSTAPLPVLGTSWTIDIHDDLENDDLWSWENQVVRGYTDPALIGSATQRSIPTLHRDRWLAYAKGPYLTGLTTDNSNGDWINNSASYCHVFVRGLCMYGITRNDPAAITRAEEIVDGIIPGLLTRHGANYPLPAGWVDRSTARQAAAMCHLVEATGKQKWIVWRDKYIERLVNATNWMEAPTMGMYPGTGFYYWPQTSSSWGYTQADIDAGIRMHQSFYMGMFADALWFAYLQTGRADVKDRVIKLARFFEHYAFDPTHTIPMTGTRFGHQNGAIWHQQVDGDAWSGYGFSVVNAMVRGYKVTGDVALLNKAKFAFRQASKFREGYPRAYGPPWPTLGVGNHVPDNEVWSFIDTRAHTASGSFVFTWDKGAFQYSYELLENGGNPTLLV